jgi:hypothetical protein
MNQIELEKKWIRRDTTEIPQVIKDRYPEMGFEWKRYTSTRLNTLFGDGWQVVSMPQEKFKGVVSPIRSMINESKDTKGMIKTNRGFTNPATGGGQVGTEVRNGDLILMMLPKTLLEERDKTQLEYTKRRGSARSLDRFKSVGEEVSNKIGKNVPTFVKHESVKD